VRRLGRVREKAEKVFDIDVTQEVEVPSGKLTAPRPKGRGFCAHWGFPSPLRSPSRALHHRSDSSGPAVSPGEARAHSLLSSPAPNSIVKL